MKKLKFLKLGACISALLFACISTISAPSTIYASTKDQMWGNFKYSAENLLQY